MNAEMPIRTEGELPIKKFTTPGKTKFGLDKIWAEGAQFQPLTRIEMAVQLSQLAWKSVAANPLTASLTLLTLSVVLSIFGAFVLVLQNVSVGVSSTGSGVSLRLFVHDGIASGELEQLKLEVAARPGVKSVRVISKEGALDEFRRSLGDDASLLDGLEGENPLPGSIEVTFSSSEQVSAAVEEFAKFYRTHRLVQHLQYSKSLAGQFSDLLRLVRVGGIVAILMMLAVTAFVVATTIRLAMYAHRQEIQIMRLVGATIRFIRAPFLIEGIAEGLLGALVALAVIGVGYRTVAEAISGSEIGSAFGVKLQFLPLGWICIFLLLGPLLGLLGSYLAVRRFSEE